MVWDAKTPLSVPNRPLPSWDGTISEAHGTLRATDGTLRAGAHDGAEVLRLARARSGRRKMNTSAQDDGKRAQHPIRAADDGRNAPARTDPRPCRHTPMHTPHCPFAPVTSPVWQNPRRNTCAPNVAGTGSNGTAAAPNAGPGAPWRSSTSRGPHARVLRHAPRSVPRHGSPRRGGRRGRTPRPHRPRTRRARGARMRAREVRGRATADRASARHQANPRAMAQQARRVHQAKRPRRVSRRANHGNRANHPHPQSRRTHHQ